MKKLATYLAITAVVANMGVAAVFAQDVVGTQDLGCSTTDASTFVNGPDVFVIGTGSRSITNENDDSVTETLNSAYFGPVEGRTATDLITISADTPFTCGDAGNAVSLTVQASQFKRDIGGGVYTGVDLMSYGADNVSGGGDNYWGHFSVETSAAAACSGAGCLLADGVNTETSSDFNGNGNYFTSATANNPAVTNADADAVLLPAGTGIPSAAVTLYSNLLGMNGTVEIPGLDFNYALPANITAPGTYGATITYTLS